MSLTEALYIILVFIVLFFLMGICVYILFLIYSWLKGAPYVATENEELREIFEKAGLQEGMVFMELGCGDGRVVRKAVRKYKVKGIGIDINPILILTARLITYFQKVKNIKYRRENVLNSDFSEADVIYIYLFPLLVQKLRSKLLDKTKRPLTIIAHGFAIDYLKEYKYEEIKGRHFKTYYYRLP